MSYQTLDELTQRVILRLSQVTGSAVQRYSAPIIADLIQSQFDFFFDEMIWPQFKTWRSYVLDGSTGIVTTDISWLTRYEDLIGVYFDKCTTPLAQLPSTNFNPLTLTGSFGKYIDSNPDSLTRVFKVYPIDSVGTIHVNGKARPSIFIGTDIVKMDSELLINFAAWCYCEDDGTNPGATEKFQVLGERRLKQLNVRLSAQPIQLDTRQAEYPTDWNQQ